MAKGNLHQPFFSSTPQIRRLNLISKGNRDHVPTQRTTLDMLHLNIQCFANKSLLVSLNIQGTNQGKFDQLSIDIASLDVKFVCISETWCKNESIDTFHLPGFSVKSAYCRQLFARGGVAIWARNDMEVSGLDLSNYCQEKDFEICGIKYGNIVILNVYRTPDSNFNVFIGKIAIVLEKYCKRNRNLIMVGDFNVNLLANSREKHILLSVINSFNLFQLVMEPTRPISGTLIDHAYTNLKHGFSVEVLRNVLSDHSTIVLNEVNPQKESINKSSGTYVYRRCFSATQKNNFNDMLNTEDWKNLDQPGDINTIFDTFYNTFLSYFNICFPVKKLEAKIPDKRDWVTTDVKQSSSNLKDLYEISLITPAAKERYRTAKKRHQKLIEESKKQFYGNKILHSNNQAKTTWKIIAEVLNKKPKASPNIELNINDKVEKDATVVCNLFNSHFIDNVKDAINNVNPPIQPIKPIEQVHRSMWITPFTEPEIHKILTQLKNKNSSGPDEVPANIIKSVAVALIKPLTLLVNLSIAQATFPDVLKISRIVPIYKSGDEKSPYNYRPVSLTSVFSKIFEYAILQRLNNYLVTFNILHPNQHGFRQNLSTITAIHDFYQKVLQDVNLGGCPVGVFCDLSRAFDCVDHSILCDKLSAYGIRGKALQWFSSYLSTRSQYVEIQSQDGLTRTKSRSTRLPVETGVPQGSVLGPVLFLLYINDLVRNIKGELVMYADDTSIIINERTCHNPIQESTNHELMNLSNWFRHNKLLLNGSKTNYLRFHTRQNSRDMSMAIKVDNQTLRCTNVTKFLGIQLESTLQWNNHCQELVKKINTACYQIRTLKSALDFKNIKNFYFAQVYSRLSYGITVWGSSSGALEVFKAQKRIIRCMMSAPPTQSCKPLFRDMEIMTVPGIYIYQLLIFTYKNKHKFQLNTDTHDYNTRNKNICIPFTRYELVKESPDFLGPKLFNLLPPDIQCLNSEFKFKKYTKKMVLDKNPYSISEFFLNDV